MNPTIARYRRALDGVGDVLRRIPADRLRSPSPCPGWTTLHVLGHVIDGQRQIAALLTGDGPRAPRPDPLELVRGDPEADWRAAYTSMRELLEVTDPNGLVPSHHGEVSAQSVLATAVIEPLVHTWDLARAGGVEVSLDDEAVDECLAAVTPMAGRFAATGMYAPAVFLPGHTSPRQRLLGLLGRQDDV
ncbi:TIGR03086 family metal-binding protein [Streptomyces sp. NPDC002039]|uniref:TIGR03086 family metal-binding protein n=1 Tax=Streptomyces sp. NPDC002039 TaxID=3154660 RepID=UPI003316B7E3